MLNQFNLTIRKKLLLFILVPFILILSISLYMNYTTTTNKVTDIVEQNGRQVLKGNTKQLTNWVKAKKQEMILLSDIIRLDSNWDDNPELIFKKLNSLYTDDMEKIFANLMLINKQGEAWTTQDNRKYNLNNRDYFKETSKTAKLSVGKAIESKLSGKNIFVIAVPLHNEAGEITGYLGGNISLKPFQEMVSEIKLGESGYGYVVNNNGMLIAHPTSAFELNLTNSNNKSVGEELAEITEKMITGENGVDKYEFKGVEKYTFYHHLGEVGWSLAVTVPTQELTKVGTQIVLKSLVGYLVLLIVIIAIIVWLSNDLSEVIGELKKELTAAAKGDFTVEADIEDRGDEFGKLHTSFNQMRDELGALIGRVSEIIENLSAHSEELSASSEEGNATIENNNALVEDISASIEEISASTEEVTSFAQESSSKTEIGSENIEETVTSINQINESTHEALDIINKLDDTSQEIGEIIEMVTNIAEQTNLLALNAAIEAARAGEAGQGFAVVADEIRELAEETNQATQKIANLVEETQKRSDKGVEAVEAVQEEAEKGRKVANKSKEIFDEIKETSEQTAAQIEQTANATQNLAEKSEEVSSGTDDIRDMSNEIANSSQELADMAQELKRLIEKFNL